MRPALELDTALLEFSATLESRGLSTVVTSEQDIARILEGFENHLKTLNLWQYYVLDVKRERSDVKEALDKQDVVAWDGVDVANKTVVELTEIIRNSGRIEGHRRLEKRFGTHVPGPIAAGFVKAAFVNLQDSDALADAWVRVVDVLNVPLYEEWNEDTKAALEQIGNRVKYTRLEAHGPKLGAITKTWVA